MARAKGPATEREASAYPRTYQSSFARFSKWFGVFLVLFAAVITPLQLIKIIPHPLAMTELAAYDGFLLLLGALAIRSSMTL